MKIDKIEIGVNVKSVGFKLKRTSGRVNAIEIFLIATAVIGTFLLTKGLEGEKLMENVKDLMLPDKELFEED